MAPDSTSTHAVRRRSSPILLMVALTACGDDPIVPDVDPEVAAELLTFASIVNDHRVSVGCAPLSWAAEVAAVAQAHSQDMVERDYFSHTSPEGASPFDRMHDAGLTFSRAAENIAYGYPTPEAVLQGWLDSPGHRANIEDCALTEHGVGLHQTHWTHLFRTP